MKLRVVIVSYNVRHFLEQCILSVEKAARFSQLQVNTDFSVVVVDNNSSDDTVAHIRSRFSWVELIDNKQNVGFSKANNQGILSAKADYYLVLNPDTVIPENCFTEILDYLDYNQNIGALGVSMVDGSGQYLPESKRGFPSPLAAFFKFSGLGAVFPKSYFFNKYYLGNIDRHEIADIDVLPGAFMWVSHEAVQKVGLLDEDFFMYGEDIDWSYRIQKAGFRNVYFPKITIIHYKGESTKKGSLNYVKMFYKAMEIFINKHLKGNSRFLFVILMKLAIWTQAGFAMVRRLFQRVLLPITDAAIFSLVYWLSVDFAIFLKHNPEYYPHQLLVYGFGAMLLFWLAWHYITGAYLQPVRIQSYWKSAFFGTMMVFVVYAFLPETLRFSRLVLVIATLIFPLAAFLARMVLSLPGFTWFKIEKMQSRKVLIVGSGSEAERVAVLLHKQRIAPMVLGYFSDEKTSEVLPYLGNFEQFVSKVQQLGANEIIFCSKDIEFRRIILFMRLTRNHKAEVKIAPENCSFIVGSQSAETQGELYLNETDLLTLPRNRRNKRVSEIIIGLLVFPVVVVLAITKQRVVPLRKWWQVCTGKLHLIGYRYHRTIGDETDKVLVAGILYPEDQYTFVPTDENTLQTIHQLYVRNYDVLTDFFILLQSVAVFVKRMGQ